MHKTIGFLTFIAAISAAQACDLCGTTLISHPWDPRAGLTIGASEQFTRMKTLQQDGREIDNDAREKLDSSVTQIYLGYHFTPRFGIQVNTPLIRRTFRRVTDDGIEEGSVSGLGDVSIAANWLAIDHRTEDLTFQVQLSAGLKFPTGDSDRVKEEGAAGHHHGSGEESQEQHETDHIIVAKTRFGPGGLAQRSFVVVPIESEVDHDHVSDHDEDTEPSGIHGHDLALGTGSVDGIFGATVNLRWKRIFFAGEVQYALRGDGKHDYDYADDFRWSAGPGVTLVDLESHTFSIAFVCSGETKGEDRFRGEKSDDTAITQVFLGPKFSGTSRDRFAAELSFDIPVHQDNSGVQIVPDYRLRASVSWMF